MIDPQHRDSDHAIDLESSVPDEMHRVIGCDSDEESIAPQTGGIDEPHHRRTGASELLNQQFPPESDER